MAAILGQRSKGRKIYLPFQVELTSLLGMLRKHSKHTCILLRLIQTRAEENQRWRQVQNPIPSPRRHSEVFMLSGRQHMVEGVKGTEHYIITLLW